MSQLPAPVVAELVALMMRTAAPVAGAVNASSSVVNTGAAVVPVTSTVYVLPAVNDGEKPARLVVEFAVRTASCGLALLTRTHELAEPYARLLLPVPTVPSSAMSRFVPPVVALMKRTVVLSLSTPIGSSSSSLHAAMKAALASARKALVIRRDCTRPP